MFAKNQAPAIAPLAKSSTIDATQQVTFTTYERADRAKRQTIEAIESCETLEILRKYVEDESLLIDAIHLFSDSMSAEIEDAEISHEAMLREGLNSLKRASGRAPATTAIAQSKPLERKSKMFATNKIEGSLGPWMTWSSNGSAMKGFKPATWVQRGTHEGTTEKFEEAFAGFESKCVFDLDSLKLGWEKDGAQGQAPERRYSSHYSVAMPIPDESKKPSGANAWSNCLQVRVATSPTQAHTWEQGSFGAYEGFIRLSRLIEAQWGESQNGKLLPLVQQSDVEQLTLKSGTTNIPIFSLLGWVERPDVLKDAAPQIAANTAPAPAPAPAPAANVQPDTSAVSAAATF